MDKAEFINRAKALAENYQPNTSVKQRLSKLRLIAVVGTTGAGKSSIIDKSGIPLVISDMTRAPRSGEKDGVDVNFRNDYDQLLKEIKKGEFVQFLVGHTEEFYGTKLSSYPSGGVCAMPILTTALPVFQSLGFESVKIVYVVPPSFEEWMQRTRLHDDPDLMKRLVEAEESLTYAANQKDMAFIINDDLDIAVQEFKSIAYDKMEDKDSSNNGKAVVRGLLVKLREKLVL